MRAATASKYVNEEKDGLFPRCSVNSRGFLYWDGNGVGSYTNFREEDHFQDGGEHMRGVKLEHVVAMEDYLRECGAGNAKELLEQFRELCKLTCM